MELVPCAWPVFIRSACVLAPAAPTHLQVVPMCSSWHVTFLCLTPVPCGQLQARPAGRRWCRLVPWEARLVPPAAHGQEPWVPRQVAVGPCASLTTGSVCSWSHPGVAFVGQVSRCPGCLGGHAEVRPPWAAVAFRSGCGLHTLQWSKSLGGDLHGRRARLGVGPPAANMLLPACELAPQPCPVTCQPSI